MKLWWVKEKSHRVALETRRRKRLDEWERKKIENLVKKKKKKAKKEASVLYTASLSLLVSSRPWTHRALVAMSFSGLEDPDVPLSPLFPGVESGSLNCCVAEPARGRSLEGEGAESVGLAGCVVTLFVLQELNERLPGCLALQGEKVTNSIQTLILRVQRRGGGEGRTPSLSLYLFKVGNVAVSQARQQLSEVAPLVTLPALPVGLQVGVEALGPVLAALHLQGDLQSERTRDDEQLQDGGGGGGEGGLQRESQ